MLRGLIRRWMAAGSGAGALLERAVERHENGDLEAAELGYREILQAQPDHPRALHLIGLVHAARGRTTEAVAALERATRADESQVDARVDLGNLQRRLGDVDAAERCFRAVLESHPDHPGANRGLGHMLADAGDGDGAIGALTRLADSGQATAGDRHVAAVLLMAGGALQDAVVHLEEAILLDPGDPDLHARLGNALLRLERPREAEARLGAFADLAPDQPEAHNDLGLARFQLGDHAGAAECARRVIELAPASIAGYVNLGNALRGLGRLGEAVSTYRLALEREPENGDALNNLADALKDQSRVEEAIDHFRRAVAASPEQVRFHSNLLMTLHYAEDLGLDELFQGHEEWAARHAPAEVESEVPVPDPDPDRVLRVGYLSGDLHGHPMGRFLEPVLAVHDPAQVRVSCYSVGGRRDAVTRRLQASGARWCDVAGLDHASLRQRLLDDGLDVLVDLAGHTATGRLPVFAARAAPVQVAWMGYLHSTGVAAMDWLLGDPVAVPESGPQRFVEQVHRLPGSFLCYGSPGTAPDRGDPPSLESGGITFGCFGNLAKLSDACLDDWAALLAAEPRARVLVKGWALEDDQTGAYLSERMARHGLPAERVTLEGWSAHHDYLSAYRRIDVMLDTYPFSGGTTSCDALWMGVPVVTRPGAAMVSRTSASVLSCLGLDDCVTASAEAYRDTALALAADEDRRAALRRELPDRFATTTLGDARLFTRGLESAFREMWRARVA